MIRACIIVLAAGLLAGCGGGGGGGGAGAQGGAAGLPGPLPSNAVIAPEDTKAPRAGDFELTLLDGTKVKASTLWAKRPVVVDFASSWCDRCAARQSMLDDLAGKYKDLVAFVAVAHQDKAADLRAYLKQHHVPYAAAIDGPGTIWRQYAVDEPPVIVVIGKGGRLLRGWTTDVPEDTLDGVLRSLASTS